MLLVRTGPRGAIRDPVPPARPATCARGQELRARTLDRLTSERRRSPGTGRQTARAGQRAGQGLAALRAAPVGATGSSAQEDRVIRRQQARDRRIRHSRVSSPRRSHVVGASNLHARIVLSWRPVDAAEHFHKLISLPSSEPAGACQAPRVHARSLMEGL